MTLSKRYSGILIAVGVILSIPLIAMQFTNEVNWSPLDFLVMGALLLTFAFIGDLALRKAKSNIQRIILIAIILISFLLIWAELAVGIFGSPFAGS